jgi:hypothetical protein
MSGTLTFISIPTQKQSGYLQKLLRAAKTILEQNFSNILGSLKKK